MNCDVQLDKKRCNVIVTAMTQQVAKQTVTVLSTEDYFPTLASIQMELCAQDDIK